MDFDAKERKRSTVRRIVWDIVFVLLCFYFSYYLLSDFITADRTAGWTAQSFVTLIGTIVFLGVAALLIFELIKKIKEYREEYHERG